MDDQRTIERTSVMNDLKISAKNVNVYYGSNHAIKDVSVDIADKTVTAFIGPSGCGKSTFLRCINRMNDTIDVARVTGDILIDGEDIYKPDYDIIKLRQRVGIVFARPVPLPMSIYRNLSYGLELKGIRDKKTLDNAVHRSLNQAALWDEVSEAEPVSEVDL